MKLGGAESLPPTVLAVTLTMSLLVTLPSSLPEIDHDLLVNYIPELILNFSRVRWPWGNHSGSHMCRLPHVPGSFGRWQLWALFPPPFILQLGLRDATLPAGHRKGRTDLFQTDRGWWQKEHLGVDRSGFRHVCSKWVFPSLTGWPHLWKGECKDSLTSFWRFNNVSYPKHLPDSPARMPANILAVLTITNFVNS